MTASAREIVRQLEAVSAEDSILRDYVRLRIGIVKAQADVLEQLAGSATPARSEIARESAPLVQPRDVPFEPRLVKRLFGEIAAVCRECGNPRTELERVEAAAAMDDELLPYVARHAAFSVEEGCLAMLAERIEVPGPMLLFIGRLVAAPFVTHAAGGRRDDAPDGLDPDGSCPICGSTPGLASLRPEDGARVLHCSLCGGSWRFARLACPFCGNRDQCGLSRLTVEGQDARWIEACEQCRHYLKTIDRRGTSAEEPFVPLVEETAGLYLDLAAEKQGYASKPPYAAVG